MIFKSQLFDLPLITPSVDKKRQTTPLWLITSLSQFVPEHCLTTVELNLLPTKHYLVMSVILSDRDTYSDLKHCETQLKWLGILNASCQNFILLKLKWKPKTSVISKSSSLFSVLVLKAWNGCMAIGRWIYFSVQNSISDYQVLGDFEMKSQSKWLEIEGRDKKRVGDLRLMSLLVLWFPKSRVCFLYSL